VTVVLILTTGLTGSTFSGGEGTGTGGAGGMTTTTGSSGIVMISGEEVGAAGTWLVATTAKTIAPQSKVRPKPINLRMGYPVRKERERNYFIACMMLLVTFMARRAKAP